MHKSKLLHFVIGLTTHLEHRNNSNLNKIVSLYKAPDIGRALYETFLTQPQYVYTILIVIHYTQSNIPQLKLKAEKAVQKAYDSCN